MQKKIETLISFTFICLICPFILIYSIYYIAPLLNHNFYVHITLWIIIFLFFLALIHLDRCYVHIISIVCLITIFIEVTTLSSDLSIKNTKNDITLFVLTISNIVTSLLLILGFTYIKSKFKNHKNLGGFFILGLMQTSICMLFPNYIAPEPHKNYKEQIIIIHWIMNMEYLILSALYIYETTRPFIKGRNSYKIIKWLLKEMKKSSS